MTLENKHIAETLEKVASLLELDESSPFRISAYRRAAETVHVHREALAEMVERGENLTEIQDVGPSIAKAIEELVKTGKLEYLDELLGKSGPGILELMRIPGLGPKRVRQLRDVIGVTSIEELRAAIDADRLKEIPGFGEKSQAQVKKKLERMAAESDGT